MDLKNKLDGACLDFATVPLDRIAFAQTKDEAITTWIKKKVKNSDIIFTLNLPPALTKKWLKKTYPEYYFKNYIWEIHSNGPLEQEIVKERSISLVFGGLLNLAKKAKLLGLNPENPFIKYTPMKQALQFELGEIKGMQELVTEVKENEIRNSSVYYSKAIICEDGLKESERERSVDFVKTVVTY